MKLHAYNLTDLNHVLYHLQYIADVSRHIDFEGKCNLKGGDSRPLNFEGYFLPEWVSLHAGTFSTESYTLIPVDVTYTVHFQFKPKFQSKRKK